MCTHKNYITLHSHTYMSLRACWFFLRQQKSESLIWPDLCALANLRVTRLQWWMPTSRCWSCHFASHNAGADVMSARLQVTKEHVFCFIHVMSRNYFGSDTDISTYNSTYMNVHIIYVHIYIYIISWYTWCRKSYHHFFWGRGRFVVPEESRHRSLEVSAREKMAPKAKTVAPKAENKGKVVVFWSKWLSEIT